MELRVRVDIVNGVIIEHHGLPQDQLEARAKFFLGLISTARRTRSNQAMNGTNFGGIIRSRGGGCRIEEWMEQEDIEVIVVRLQRMENAANVHTIRMAVFYLRALAKPVRHIGDDDKVRRDRFSSLITNCRGAVNTGVVTNLAQVMRSWFGMGVGHEL